LALPAAGVIVAKLASKKVLGITKDVAIEGGQLSQEIFGFDFILFFMKLITFFVVAIVIDKIHFVIVGTANVAATILRAFGINLPSDEPDFLKKLFSVDGYNGIHYWDIVKFGAIILTVLEFFTYYNSLKRSGGKASPFTIAIFGLILVLLTAFTVPELIEKLKKRMSVEGLQ